MGDSGQGRRSCLIAAATAQERWIYNGLRATIPYSMAWAPSLKSLMNGRLASAAVERS